MVEMPVKGSREEVSRTARPARCSGDASPGPSPPHSSPPSPSNGCAQNSFLRETRNLSYRFEKH